MTRGLIALAVLIVMGLLKLPVERDLAALHRQEHFRGRRIQSRSSRKTWATRIHRRTERISSHCRRWSVHPGARGLGRHSMGPNAVVISTNHNAPTTGALFWDTAAWHMAWNASVAAMNDTNQPRQALRVKAQREYFALGKDFLERGIKNNPDRPELYEALARLYKEKYKDHERAAEYYAKAAPCRKQRRGTGVSRRTSFRIARSRARSV
jgi:hypothetical protein